MTETEWWQARIEATRAMIVATEAAILAVESGAQSYTLDTGAGRQTVTRANLSELRLLLQWLYEQLASQTAAVEALLGGGTSGYGVPVY